MFSLLFWGPFGVSLVLSLAYVYFFVGRRPGNFPPGPPTLPLIGNLHQMPKIGLHLQLTEWAKQYGGIYSLKLGPVTAIVLTDRRLVKDLIDRKSLIYSDRPPSYVAHHLISGGIRVVTETYGEVWKTYRKLIHQQFMERVCDTQHIIVQNAEAVQMLRDFCISPDQHMRHPKRYSNSSTLSTGDYPLLCSFEMAEVPVSLRYTNPIPRYPPFYCTLRLHG